MPKTRHPEESDEILRDGLIALGKTTKDYWSFRENATRKHAHSYFQYPAMMVPQMQGDILKACLRADPRVAKVFDPFVGSGTAMTESMMLGKSFVGVDINPLAILLCRAKSIPFFDGQLEMYCNQALARAERDSSRTIEASFPGWNKWFNRVTAIQLSRLKRSIQAVNAVWARRFLWVALAETVRLTSNSRTSTFKLHVRSPTDTGNQLLPLVEFERILTRNMASLREAKATLHTSGLLVRGRFSGSVDLELRDIRKRPNGSRRHKCDLLLTSPPYGDNHTTIPYGQHSFLPLQWICLSDIDRRANDQILQSTHELDSKSLGGSRRIDSAEATSLRRKSRNFGQFLRELKAEPADRTAKVVAFCRDLDASLDPILWRLRKNAYMVWTVGNRRVADKSFPLDRILADLLVSRGVVRVASVKRSIPSKRMAVRNSIAATMGRETIMVLRKAHSE